MGSTSVNKDTIFVLVNAGPTVLADEYTVFANDPPVYLQVLTNDANALGISSLLPWWGSSTISIGPGGTNILFAPKAGTFGTNLFFYTATNSIGGQSRAPVTVHVVSRPEVQITNPASFLFTNISVVTISGTASDWDGSISNIELYMGSTRVLQTNGPIFSFPWTTNRAGFYTFTALARDDDGYTNASLPITFQVQSANPTNHLPIANITSPAEFSTNIGSMQVSTPFMIRDGQVAVFGTASDPDGDPVSWQLVLLDPKNPDTTRPLYNVTPGDIDDQGFHSGTNNNSFGTVDLTMVENGSYLLTLVVRGGGDTALSSVHITVDSNLKIGQFSFSEQDLVIPVSGIPLTVVRTYNSINPRSSDFGYSWTYALNSMEVQLDDIRKELTVGDTIAPFADDPWDSQGLPEQASIRTGGGWDVTLNLPDGRRRTFVFNPRMAPNELKAYARWTSDVDVHATLSVYPAGHDEITFFPSIRWADDDASIGLTPLENHDIPGWALTNYDGTAYLITRPLINTVLYDLGFGKPALISAYGQPKLTRIVQRTGDQIVIGSDKIYHQFTNGTISRAIYFDRDNQNRITAIHDPISGSNGIPSVRYIYHQDTGNLLQVLKLVDRIAGTYVTNKYHYDHPKLPHYITQIDNADGVPVTRNLYDGSGKLIGLVDPEGRTTSITHDASGRVELITDRLLRKTAYVYDSRGNVIAVTNALGTDIQQVSQFGYDDLGNQVAATNALGVITLVGYDVNGFPFAVTNDFSGPLKQVSTTTFTPDGLPLVSVDARGFGSTNTYDSRGLLTNVANADGIILTNYYNSAGWLVGSIDATGVASTNIYDSATGNLLRAGLGYYSNGWNAVSWTGYAYDNNGNQVSVTNAMNFVTRYGYDALNRVTVVTNAYGLPEETRQTTIYDAVGRVARTFNARGVVTAYGYDSKGRRTSITNALGSTVQQVTTYAYDAEGNQIQIVDALGRQTDYIYDALNRQFQTIFPPVNGAVRKGVTNGFDVLNRLVAFTNEAGIAKGYGYDRLGRLTAVTDGLGKSTLYGYDAAGNQTSQTDALSRVTVFDYDPLGRRFKRSLPLSVWEGFRYDKASRVTAQTNFNGTIVTNQYDQIGRLSKRWNGTNLLESYSYSPLNQITTRVDASGTHSWIHDALGRVKTNNTPAGTLKYTYDAAGNLLTMASAGTNGVSLTYQYDELNRLKQVRDNRLSGNQDSIVQYDGLGNLQLLGYPNGVTNSYAYDSLNRVTNLTWVRGTTSVASFSYTLGAAGNRLTLAETNNGIYRNYSWGYDNNYRLTSEQVTGTTPIGTLSYNFDDVGNRNSRAGTIGSLTPQSFNYDQRDQLDNDSSDTTASTYSDANGNLTSYGATYTYDWANRLLTQSSPTVTITYDADGNRIKKVVGGVTNWYLVASVNPSGYPQVVEELTGATPSTLGKVYTYGLDLISQRQQPSGTVSFYGYDGLGNVRFLCSTNGTVTDFYAYDAYGNLLQGVGVTPNNYRYAGEQLDPDLNKYYLRARYYDPSIGRFLTRDTFEGNQQDPLSLHKYLYCQDNPVNRRDPSGHYGDLVEFSLASSLATTIRGTWEGARAPGYQGAITAALALAFVIEAADVIPMALEKIKERRTFNKVPYVRYDIRPGITYFGPGTWVLGAEGASLEWSRALSLTHAMEVNTLYMYTVLARPADVTPFGLVSGLPQYKLNTTISAPDVILTRILRKPDDGYQGPY